ncbi:MAG TPA: hypothetical protein VG734_15085 [Lacunisphaera sp.]|nr:hypothetical protein [Lacunisphaera sp.]
MTDAFRPLLPLLPIAIALCIAGARIGLVTARSFFALAKAMEEKGYTMDRATASDLYKMWRKKPECIISDSDPEELRVLKAAHVRAFVPLVRPWKIASRIALIAVGIGAFVIFSSQ